MAGKKASNQHGFTIVEMLIVLATAGLILLIIFQAIPTLQRNSRNNQRKQDVQMVLEAVSHYMLNHSGNMPPVNCGAGSEPACDADDDKALRYTKLGFYEVAVADAVVIHYVLENTNVSPPNNIDQVAVYNHQKCDPDNIGQPTHDAAGYRDIVALYTIETANGKTDQCQELN
jgi:prepilin-type N-terminal cleavage/methylation domain-containing protein